jgi:hypothetical protein
MNISSVNSFTLQTQDRVTEIRRDAFSVNGTDWRYIRRDRQGKILQYFFILESTAAFSINQFQSMQSKLMVGWSNNHH